MSVTVKTIEAVPIGRIFLDLANPRHETVAAEKAAIERLCEKENIYALARDIAKHGLNPLERFGVVPNNSGAKPGETTYYVFEGNRRFCALKLLSDPDLAPTSLRKAFQKQIETWSPITTVSVTVFTDLDQVRLWRDRLHNGAQGGVGRKEWNAEQKQRNDGGVKHRLAQAVLDYAQTEGFISAAQRQGKLTTVSRFVTNQVFRELLGLDQSDPDGVGSTRPKPELDILIKRFMNDLVEGEKVNSRMNGPDIVTYARPLNTLPGVTTNRIAAEPLSNDSTVKSPSKSRGAKPSAPKPLRCVHFQDEIAQALKKLGNEKLISLYHSICSIELEPHTPIIAVGAWSFFETLTACIGRNENASFDSFLNKDRFSRYGFKGDTRSYRSAIERISQLGNTVKHHPVATFFNGAQLNNDLTALKDVILKCIEDAATPKPSKSLAERFAPG